MKPATAKSPRNDALEDLGRATLQIVHDIKNQLNGLKLYATFLRKRMETDGRAPEERETLEKLIAGLDRAARDMTALVRYTQPLELKRQPRVDLTKMVVTAERQAKNNLRAEVSLTCEIGGMPLYGHFDPVALATALKTLTDEAVNSLQSRDARQISIQVRRDNRVSPEALIEWKGVNFSARNNPFHPTHSFGTVHTALAAKVIEAHGGRFECEANLMRVYLPLSE